MFCLENEDFQLKSLPIVHRHEQENCRSNENETIDERENSLISQLSQSSSSKNISSIKEIHRDETMLGF